MGKKQICRGSASERPTTQGIQGQVDRLPAQVWQGRFVGGGALYRHASPANGDPTRLRLLCLRRAARNHGGGEEAFCLPDDPNGARQQKNSPEVAPSAQKRPPKPRNKPPRARSETGSEPETPPTSWKNFEPCLLPRSEFQSRIVT